ncbi:MAG: hypothetical protein WKF91_22005, partial [Segetibacter sp.]
MLRDSISLHNPDPTQYNEPSELHRFRQDNVLHIPRKLLHNPKVFGLMIRVCDLNGDALVVAVPCLFVLRMKNNYANLSTSLCNSIALSAAVA